MAEPTVIEAIEVLRADGYVEDFDVTADGGLQCGSCGRPHPASDAVIERTARFEGASDPDDEAVVYGLRCPACGTRGVLVAAYGPSASAEEAAVVTALQPRA